MIAGLWAIALGTAHAQDASTWERVASVRAGEGFALPDVQQRAALAELVADLATAAPRGELPARLGPRATELGLQLSIQEDRVWLHEDPEAPTGLGLLALRLGPLPSEVVLQAPHPFYDLGTGEIVATMFDEGGVRAAVIATVHRKAAPASDMSHSPTSGFQALTLALGDALVEPVVVQLHGFSDQTSASDVVLSEGSSRWWRLEEVGLRLSTALSVQDLRLGTEVPELAARYNVQGLALADRSRFLHIELDRALRDQLRESDTLRASLRGALQEVAGANPPSENEGESR